MIQTILTILEILGTIAFAVSGAFVAIKAKFDIFGVIVVGCVTAVGGGITRDVIVGQTPPAIFNNVYILGVATLASILVFLIAYKYRRRFESIKHKIDTINNYFDAAGLATFSVMGVELAFTYNLSDNALLAIMLGVLSGVGGGLLRDLFTESPPYIFTKHIYAIASIIGASIYYVLRYFAPHLDPIIPTLVGISVIFLLRVFATIYRLKLPKIHIEDKKQ